MGAATLLSLLEVASLVVVVLLVAFCMRCRCNNRPGSFTALVHTFWYSLTIALGFMPWSWLIFDALGVHTVDVFFVAVGATLCLRVAMFSQRVESFRTGAAVAHAELSWYALALSFGSCALLWLCVLVDGDGVLPTIFVPVTWECSLLSQLRVPSSHAITLLAYNVTLSGHCLVWVWLTRRSSHRLSRTLVSSISEDFSPLSTAMFNVKQFYLWLLLIVGGSLHFPLDLVSIVLFVETLHTFKSVVLNMRLAQEALPSGWPRQLARGVAFLTPAVGMLSYSVAENLELQGGTSFALVGTSLVCVSGLETAADLALALMNAAWARQMRHPHGSLHEPLASGLQPNSSDPSVHTACSPRALALLGSACFALTIGLILGLVDILQKSSETFDTNLIICLLLILGTVAAGMAWNFVFCKAVCFTMRTPRRLAGAISMFVVVSTGAGIILFACPFGARRDSYGYQFPGGPLCVLYAGTSTSYDGGYDDLHATFLGGTVGFVVFLYIAAGLLVIASALMTTKCIQYGWRGAARGAWREAQLFWQPAAPASSVSDRQQQALPTVAAVEPARSCWHCSDGVYGCSSPAESKSGAYAASLLHIYTVLLPLLAVWTFAIGGMGRHDAISPPSLLVFWITYVRLLNFWLKVETLRDQPMRQLHRFWRTAVLGWIVAFNGSFTFIAVTPTRSPNDYWLLGLLGSRGVVSIAAQDDWCSQHSWDSWEFNQTFQNSFLSVFWLYTGVVVIMALAFPSRSRPKLRLCSTLFAGVPPVAGLILLLLARRPLDVSGYFSCAYGEDSRGQVIKEYIECWDDRGNQSYASNQSSVFRSSACIGSTYLYGHLDYAYLPAALACLVFAVDSLAWLYIASKSVQARADLTQLREWLKRDVSATMLTIFSLKQVYLWLLLLQARPAPSVYQLQAYGEVLHSFKGFALSSRMLHHRPRLRLVFAITTTLSLALFVLGTLWNHLDPDSSARLPLVLTNTSDAPGVAPSPSMPPQRTLFLMVTCVLVLPELVSTASLVLRLRTLQVAAASPAAPRAVVGTATTAVESGSPENAALSLNHPQMCHDLEQTPVSAGLVIAPPSVRERRELLGVLLAVALTAGTGFARVQSHEQNFRAATAADAMLAVERRFLLAFSTTMWSPLSAPCNASGTLTADATAQCGLWGAHCTSATRRLIGLHLAGQAFHGGVPSFAEDEIPVELAALDLSCNTLSGTLPTTIGRLRSLQSLHVENNSLVGALPTQLGQLTRLEQCTLVSQSPWLNYPDNQFDCASLPESLPLVCGGEGGNASTAPELRCHPPFAPPPPLSPPSPPHFER